MLVEFVAHQVDLRGGTLPQELSGDVEVGDVAEHHTVTQQLSEVFEILLRREEVFSFLVVDEPECLESLIRRN